MNQHSIDFVWDTGAETPLSFLLSQLEHSAGSHAHLLGVGIEKLMESGQTWVMLAMNVKTHHQPEYGEVLTLKTWPSRIVRFFTFRDFEITNSAGKLIAQARTQWILFDLASRKPMPLPSHLNDLVKNAPQVFDFQRVRWSHDVRWQASLSVSITDKHTDINEHVNNKNYMAWSVQAHQNSNKNKLPKSLEIEFQKEAFVGDTLIIERNSDEMGKKCARILRDGEVLAQCQFEEYE